MYNFFKWLFYFVIFIGLFFTYDTDESASATVNKKSDLIGDNWRNFLAVFGGIFFILLIILPTFLPEIQSYYKNKGLNTGIEIKDNLVKLVWFYFIVISFYKWYYIYQSDDDPITSMFNFFFVLVKSMFLIVTVQVLSDVYVDDYLGLDTSRFKPRVKSNVEPRVKPNVEPSVEPRVKSNVEPSVEPGSE